jgi:hypothetical protein
MRRDRGRKMTTDNVGLVSDTLANIYRIAGMVLIGIDYQRLCGKML